ncbi:MAG: hypothetical protein ACI9SI_001905 [Polaribacter sp.]|jgi:hypothetical protein
MNIKNNTIVESNNFQLTNMNTDLRIKTELVQESKKKIS